MSSLAAPAALAPRRAWHTDLPVLLVAVCWGASYLAAKEITTARTVLAVLVLRFALALPALAVAGRRALRALTGAQWRGAALLGLILAGIFLLETYGVVHTSATNAGLIISLTMVFTPLAEAVVTRTRPTPSFLGAAALSVLGVVLLTQGADFTRPSLGDLLMLLAACARTVHVLAMSRIRAVQDADALPLTTVQLLSLIHGLRRAGVGGAAVPVGSVHGVRLLRADVGRPPHLPLPGQPAARHRAAVGRRRRHRAGWRPARRTRPGGRRAGARGDGVGTPGGRLTRARHGRRPPRPARALTRHGIAAPPRR